MLEKVDYFYNDILSLNIHYQAAAYSDDVICVYCHYAGK